jgi:murein DD-endopeptidase MepM/ murein hydrolase activator NlpD
MTMSRARLLLIVLVFVLIALLLVVLVRGRPAAPSVTADHRVEAPGLSTKPIYELRDRDLSGNHEHMVRNLLAGPIEVRCEFVVANNVEGNPRLPRQFVVPALAERKVTELRSIDPDKPASAEVTCSAMIGDPSAEAPDDVVYALPFYPGTKFTIDQGFGGAFSHNDAESHYSIDFSVPEGTPVIAARDGIVMQIEEDFRASGADAQRYGDRANYVRILHDDGSMALYAHLAPHSILFRPGDRVQKGNFLAKSGNTGLSTGPHLHFSVQKNAGFQLRSIPFTMPGVVPSD